MIIYRTAFPVGDCVLVHLSSLLIHGLLFWLNDDGGAILGERLTKHSSGFSTIPFLAESLLSTKPSQDNASLSSPPSIPMSTSIQPAFSHWSLIPAALALDGIC